MALEKSEYFMVYNNVFIFRGKISHDVEVSIKLVNL